MLGLGADGANSTAEVCALSELGIKVLRLRRHEAAAPYSPSPLGLLRKARTIQLPLAQLPLAQLPFARVPFAKVPFAQLPFARLPFAQLPFARLPFAEMPFA